MKTPAILRIGLVQQCFASDRKVNWQHSADGIRRAKTAGARLVVLPELHASRYFCQVEAPENFDLAEPIPGPSTKFFGALARRWKLVLVLSLFERRARGVYHNTAVVLERDGSIAGRYRKMHIPDDPGYYEKFYFAPGDTGFSPIRTSVGSLGVLVCWDQWYPEAARLMAMAGADLLVYPTAIGWSPSEPKAEQRRQREAWELSLRGHAIANGLPVVSVNRVGVEPGPSRKADDCLRFWGGSFVAGCQGEVLVRSGEEEAVLVVAVDLGRSEAVRRMWPFFRDRRIDAYGDLVKRFRQ